jgi:hypothetical protein
MTLWNKEAGSTMKVTTRSNIIVVLFVLLFLLVGLGSGPFAAPKKSTSAKAGDCAACHESEKVLPANHANTKDMGHEGCLPCHQKTGKGSLRTKMPGSHVHSLSGVNCEKCHGKTQKQEAVEMTQCIPCHNPLKLVEKTAKVKPENPHTSPHYGNSLDCNLCHRQHGKSENYCNQCHNFNFTTP